MSLVPLFHKSTHRNNSVYPIEGERKYIFKFARNYFSIKTIEFISTLIEKVVLHFIKFHIRMIYQRLSNYFISLTILNSYSSHF